MPTTFTNDFSREIFEQTYRMGAEDVNQAQLRVATYLASIERDPTAWTQKFLGMLENFKFVPGGRISSNAGLGLTGTTLINCIVSAPGGEDIDSIEGIHRELGNQMRVLQSESGYGMCANFMRPRGAHISGIANCSPGSVEMLNIWDASSSTITAGSGTKNESGTTTKGKIRKGAQMVTLSVDHPDVSEFITAKQTPGRLTKFNMSVLVTDAFMNAVKQNLPWNLEYPDYSFSPEIKLKYKREWTGDLEAWKRSGGPVRIYKSYENANELYNEIMASTYGRNEPGVLFVDTINRLNNLWYCEHIMATNPCGEIPLPPGGVCLLGSINLTQFVNADFTDWDFDALKSIIPIAVRFMDNVNDLSLVPLEIEKWNMMNKRRIGLGVLGYGSSLFMMKQRYGSPKALEMTEKLMRFICHAAYNASVDLAIEKGAFPLFDAEKYLESNFIKTLDPELRDRIRAHGIRNSHLTSNQPTGHGSIYANNVSGGLEPIYMPEYVRTSIMPFPPEGLHIPKSVDWVGKKYQGPTEVWSWAKEGDESILFTEFAGAKWKFDRSRGLLRETAIEDYAVANLKARGEWDPAASWVATVPTLTIDEHVSTMIVFSKNIDQSMSKTVNLPASYPFRDFKKLYLQAWETGTIKGITTYRDGTMTSVLSAPAPAASPLEIVPTSAPARPKELPCDINIVKYKQAKYIVLVGLLGGVPYEVFAFKEKDITFKPSLKEGTLVKVESGKYNLVTPGFDINDIGSNFNTCEESLVARLISLSLKNGVCIDSVYHQLVKTGDSIASFSRVIARTLSKYVKSVKETACSSCGSPNGLIFTNGCFQCTQCGWSRCG